MYSQVMSPIGQMGEGVNTLETLIPEGAQTNDRDQVDKLFWFEEMAPEFFAAPIHIGQQYMEHSINDKTLQTILNTRFDVILIDEMFPSGQSAIAFRLKEQFGSKIAMFSTTDLFAISSQFRGLSRNPVSYPNYYTKGYKMHNYTPQDFWQRVMTIRDVIVEKITIEYISEQYLINTGNLLNIQNSWDRMYSELHASFIDYPSRYGMVTPRSIDLVYVGEHCEDSQPLPEKLDKFISDPTSKGTIYIAFGSIVNWKAGPAEVISTFVTVLNSLSDYRIIWSYAGPKLNDVKNHIMISKWAPQNDILAHKKTVLFLTHGGLKSLKEGICSETPMVFLPFFADQPKNSLYALNMGIAEAIYKKNITVEEMTFKMNKVLKDPKYANNVKKFNAHFLDNVIDPLELGVFWTEKIARTTEEQTLYYKIRGKRQTWIEYVYLELTALFLVVIYVCSQ